jgi:hypothetical protein
MAVFPAALSPSRTMLGRSIRDKSTFTREGPEGFHQPRQIAPREGPMTSGGNPAIPLHPALVMS